MKNEKQEIQEMISKEDFKTIARIGRRYLGVADYLDDVDAIFNIENIRESLPAALAAAIEYGRKTATESNTMRQWPVMTTAEPGKKFPITEAHTAAMELHDALVNAFEYYEEKDANHPREVALNVMLADLMEQALYLECAIAKLVRAEK